MKDVEGVNTKTQGQASTDIETDRQTDRQTDRKAAVHRYHVAR